AERLEWHAAKFLIHIRETCKVSHTAIEHIIDGIQSLLTEFSSGILEQVSREVHPETGLIHFDVLQQMYKETFPPSLLFSSVDSKHKLDKILTQKFNMVIPEKTLVGTDLVWKCKHPTPGVPDLIEKEVYAYTVPFLSNLKNLLYNDEVRFCVDNPRLKENNVYRTVLDGSSYQNNDFFRKNRNAIAIILFYDDLEVVNPLGANIKKHKLAMFYWTLANIYPEVRSTLKNVNLLSIVKHSVLKKYGVGKILESFITDIKVLQNEGVTVNVKGVEKVYKGSLLFVAGDTPASAFMGGFKESVSAYRPCRTCMTTQNEWRNSFSSENFILREKESHQEYVRVVTEPHLNKRTRAFWSRRYGVTNRSALMDIPEFDVTKCVPQDGMHVLAEGVVEVHCRAFLRYCIVEKRIFTIDDLNSKMRNFNFGHLKRDAPASLLE
ncbi:PREDICTED: uncharacterized protein LOC108765282, partial [Trachymyrmex cornetzi]|uniref:uncharacterized protein LOC108765282 n=1 Tax=Trachymyrmex cornetzi TaxID=471704 RepID=UPI00084F0AEB